MFLNICFLLTLSGAITAELVSFECYKVIKVIPTTRQQVEDLKILLLKETREVDVWKGVGAVKRPVLVSVSPRMFERYVDVFKSMGLEPVVTINNVQKLADEQKLKPQKGLKEGLRFEYHEYHTLDEISDWIDNITANYKIATKFNIGTSYENRSISAIKISTNVGGQNKPGFFMEGGIHAREWISPATVIYITSQNRMWRKTRSIDEETGCYGVDPNRNWGTSWCTEGASTDPCSDIYCGPYEFSEPEVEAVAEFIGNNAGKIKLKGAQAAVDALKSNYGTEYIIGNIAETIYIASGRSGDWTYANATVKYSYGVELRDTWEYGFLLPADQIIPSGEETLAAVIALANYVAAKRE